MQPTENLMPERAARYVSRESRRAGIAAETEEKPRPGDFLVRVVAVQTAVCLLVTLLVFGLYKSESEHFQSLRQAYDTVFSRDMENAELRETLRRAAAFVFRPQNGEASAENPSSEPSGTDAETTGENTPSEVYGAGGEDLLPGTDKASFAPLTVTGTFHKPVDYTRITSKYGYRINPVTNTYGFHSGLDMAAPEGTPIRAAFAGTVTKAAESAARGKYLILTHNNGLQTIYCHCSAVLAQEGANINGGEVIAEVGSTGQTTGPHLHLEVLLDGMRYDPAWLLGLYAHYD